MRAAWTGAAIALLLAAATAATAATATASAAPALAPPKLDVNWALFLDRADPTWLWDPTTTAPDKWYESAFVGSGGPGAMVRAPNSVDMAADANAGALQYPVRHGDAQVAAEPLGTPTSGSGDTVLQIDISSSAVWDDRENGDPWATGNFAIDRPRLPGGYLLLHTVGNLTQGAMRLRLYDAEVIANITTTVGTVSLRVLANADYGLAADRLGASGSAGTADVFAIEVTATGGEDTPAAAAARWTWVPLNATSTWADRAKNYTYNPVPETSTKPAAGGGTMTTTLQRHLSGRSHAISMLATTPAVMFVSVSGVLPGVTGGSAYTEACTIAARDAGLHTPATGILANHRAWWHAYYPASFVTFNASRMEAFYWINMYKFASATRPDRTVYDLEGPWFVRNTAWPDIHWDLNTQVLHDPLFTGNRLDMAEALWTLLDANTPNLANNVPADWRNDSAALPSGASSLEFKETCYWNFAGTPPFNCTTAPPTVTGNLMWTMQLYYRAFLYSQNVTFLQQRWLPLMARALNFYGHMQYETQAPTPALNLPKTFSPEYDFCLGNNTSYDLALYGWGLQAVIHACDDLLPAGACDPPALPLGRLDDWRSAAKLLVDPPTDANGYMIAATCPFEHSHRHFSHLFKVWPLQTLDVTPGGAGEALAETSIDHWLSLTGGLTGFCRPAVSIMNTMLGRRAAAFGNVTYLLDNWILPNTMYKESEQGACSETPPFAASAIQSWMLESWGGVVHVWAGIHDVSVSQAAFWHLRAEGGFLVSSRRGVAASTDFVFVESDTAGGGNVTLMIDGWATVGGITASPASVAIQVAPGGVVTVTLSGPGGEAPSVLLYPTNAPPADTTISVAAGNSTQFNSWGMRTAT